MTKKREHGRTQLMADIANAHFVSEQEKIAKRLERVKNINKLDNDDMTMLDYALSKNSYVVIQALKKKGAVTGAEVVAGLPKTEKQGDVDAIEDKLKSIKKHFNRSTQHYDLGISCYYAYARFGEEDTAEMVKLCEKMARKLKAQEKQITALRNK